MCFTYVYIYTPQYTISLRLQISMSTHRKMERPCCIGTDNEHKRIYTRGSALASRKLYTFDTRNMSMFYVHQAQSNGDSQTKCSNIAYKSLKHRSDWQHPSLVPLVSDQEGNTDTSKTLYMNNKVKNKYIIGLNKWIQRKDQICGIQAKEKGGKIICVHYHNGGLDGSSIIRCLFVWWGSS